MNLLFDLDGTLTDPYEGITRSISHALLTLGRPAPTRVNLKWCIGPPLMDSLAKLLATDDDELTNEALSIYRERFGSMGLFENEIYEGIPDSLRTLQEQGHLLYIATSKPTIYAQQIMKHFDLTQYFTNIHGSELDGTRSDKTSLISHILLVERLKVSETIMFGDRGHDMVGARANGVYGVGVLWGYGTRDELEASGSQTCIRHPQELSIISDEISTRSLKQIASQRPGSSLRRS
jgi:phosphoglycolate phosphatase